MAAGDDYLFRAAELLAKAECESDAKKRAELENLGWAFLRLAGQARRNRATSTNRRRRSSTSPKQNPSSLTPEFVRKKVLGKKS